MPKKQRHRIKQQCIELTLDASLSQNPAYAQQLQDRISQHCQRALLNHLEQQFDKLSHPNELHRIDRLEIDLGNIAIANLESNFIERFQQCLTQALPSKGLQNSPITDNTPPQHSTVGETTAKTPLIPPPLQSASTPSPITSQLELWQHFLQYGHLPWWADNQQKDVLTQAFATCLKADTQAFNTLWQMVVSQKNALKRLLAHVSTQQSLLFIQRRLAQTSNHQTDTLRAVLLEFLAGLTVPRQDQLLQQWLAILLETQSTADPDALLSALLTVIQEMQQKLHSEAEKEAATTIQQRQHANNKIQPHRKTTKTEKIDSSLPSSSAETSTEKPASIEIGKVDKSLPRSSVEVPTKMLKHHDHSRHARTTSLQINQPQWEKEQECYIHNAGLVILWPFLTPFFQTLGLLTEEKQFAQLDHAHHAILLLHSLTNEYNEEQQPPEYQLMLNKILCGVALESVFETDTAISKEEQQECQHLLEAVIHHASILNNMSIQGFQGSFLLRQGILRQRDGLWLLQVERQSYDVVLERFPWRFNTIKLPWMQRPLQVEW